MGAMAQAAIQVMAADFQSLPQFPDRQALVDFFRTEPYCTHDLYERADIFDWRRGALAP
jgi:hypothetical protein